MQCFMGIPLDRSRPAIIAGGHESIPRTTARRQNVAPLMVLYVAAPIFVLVVVVGSIILVARGMRGQALDLCLAVLLAGSLVVTAAGVADLIAPLLTIPLGRNFSYFIPNPSSLRPPVLPGVDRPTPEEEREQARAR